MASQNFKDLVSRTENLEDSVTKELLIKTVSMQDDINFKKNVNSLIDKTADDKFIEDKDTRDYLQIFLISILIFVGTTIFSFEISFIIFS